MGADARIRNDCPCHILVAIVPWAWCFALKIPEVIAVVVRTHSVAGKSAPHRWVSCSLSKLGSLLIFVGGGPKRRFVHGFLDEGLLHGHAGDTERESARALLV